MPVPHSGRIPGSRRSDREITVEIDDQEEAERARSSFPIVRFLNRLGPKERFLTFAVFFALLITVFSIYYERSVAENDVAADRNNEAQVALGGSLYRANCAFCHGDALEGKTGWNKDYPVGGRPALPLNGDGAISRLSDQDIFEVVKFGGQPFSPSGYKNDMPGFEMQLSDADMWAIVAHMKSIWPEAVIESQSAMMEKRDN
ncbi:MAG: c-type cytochrome [Proteobacteria bacterium]|nr:c-type cytochrome [Pseudomonadota bacterium]